MRSRLSLNSRTTLLRTCGRLALIGAAVAVALLTARAADAVSAASFADWTSASGSPAVATGSLPGGRTVTFSGTGVLAATSDTAGTSTVFNRSDFTPSLPSSDAINFNAATGNSYTLSFTPAVVNPVLDFASLGSTLHFPSGTVITGVSGDAQFSVSGSDVVGAVENPTDDANGTVQLSGTFSSISFTTSSAASTDGVYLQVGADAPITTTTTTASTTTSTPVTTTSNTTTTSSSSTGGGPKPPPFIKAMHRVPLPSTARRQVVTAETAGSVTRLQWFVNGSRRPVLTSSPAQNTLVLPPSSRTTYVTVYPVGPGGVGRLATLQVPPASLPKGHARMQGVISSRPVYTAASSGVAVQLGSASVKTTQRYCLRGLRISAENGLLDIQGCMFPALELSDLPGSTRGIVEDIARQYGLTLDRKNIDLALLRSDAYVSFGKVRVNGLDINPGPNSPVVLFPQVHRIAAPNASFSIGPLKLGAPRRFELDTQPFSGRIPFPDMPVLAGGADLLRKFNFFGDLKIDAVPGGASIRAHLQLPPILRWAGGAFNADVTLRATTDRGLILDGLRVGPVTAQLGPILVRNFQITYDGGADQLWRGQAEVCLEPYSHACLSALPEDAGGVEVRNGELTYVGASIKFPAPITLFPGLEMSRIGFGLGTNPLRFIGSTDLIALRLVDIKPGAVVVALPDSGSPFILDQNRAQLPGFPEKLYAQHYTGPTVGIVGNFGLRVPVVGSIPLGSAYFLYEYPGYVAFGGGVSYSFLDIASFNAGIAGEFNFSNGRFNLHGRGEGCVVGICKGAIGDISQKGLGICVIALGSVEHPIVSLGVEVNFANGHVHPSLINGCRWSTYAEFNVHGAGDHAVTRARTAAASRASLPLTLTLRRGDRSRTILLQGSSGTPVVRVTGPDGQTLDTPARPGLALSRGAKLRIMRIDQRSMTAVGLQDPPPGKYTIAALPGSAAVSDVSAAVDPSPARVRAHVTGSGSFRTLHFDVRRRPDQTVTFLEVNGATTRTLGTVAFGGRGTLRFTPTPGTGRRTIEARFELADAVTERLTVAHFAAPSTRLARVRGLSARHVGTHLRMSWRRVAGAAGYDVAMSSTGDPQRRVHVRGTSLTVGGITRSSAGRVTVRAVAPLRASAAAVARFRATGRPAVRFARLPGAPRLR